MPVLFHLEKENPFIEEDPGLEGIAYLQGTVSTQNNHRSPLFQIQQTVEWSVGLLVSELKPPTHWEKSSEKLIVSNNYAVNSTLSTNLPESWRVSDESKGLAEKIITSEFIPQHLDWLFTKAKCQSLHDGWKFYRGSCMNIQTKRMSNPEACVLSCMRVQTKDHTIPVTACGVCDQLKLYVMPFCTKLCHCTDNPEWFFFYLSSCAVSE